MDFTVPASGKEGHGSRVVGSLQDNDKKLERFQAFVLLALSSGV